MSGRTLVLAVRVNEEKRTNGTSRHTFKSVEEDGIVFPVESRVEEDEDLVARARLCENASEEDETRDQR